MLEIVSWVAVCILTALVDNYVYTKINKINYVINMKFVVLSLILVLTNTFSSLYLDYSIKMYFSFLMCVLYFKLLYQHNYEKVIISEFIIYIITAMAEAVFFILSIGILKIDINVFANDPGGIVMVNLFILIFPILLVEIKKLLRLLQFIAEWYDKRRTLNLIVIIILTFYVTMKILFNNFTFPNSNFSFANTLFNNSVAIIFLIFVFFFLKERTSHIKVAKEYDNLLGYVENFEALLDNQSKLIHEFNNQLIVIKNMSNSKKIENYINELFEEANSKVIFEQSEKLKHLPANGLKGFLYYKITQMEKYGINYYIDVAKEISNESIKKICDQNLKDITRVIGVFLDNAIEATKDLKDKQIIIEVKYSKGRITFSISNTFAGDLNFLKIEDAGYTTKGIGKGYGLALVRDIIKKNHILTNTKEINAIYFVQNLIIAMT